jgi:SAM-dependent methyltransferase
MKTNGKTWEVVFSNLQVSTESLLQRINKHLVQRTPLFSTVTKHLGQDLSGKTIVEVGAGSAIECLLFTLRGARCLAVDLEKEATRYAQKTASLFSKQPYLCVGNGFMLPVKSGSADLVLSQGFLEHFEPEEMAALLKEQYRIMKPKGLLLVDVPNFHSPYEVYKRINGLFGAWVYGKEVGIKKKLLITMVEKLAMERVESYGWSFKGYPYKTILDLAYMVPLLAARNVMQLFGYGHDSIGLLFRKKSGGGE